ncbi:hypothetical protein CPB85DRAFT_376514 [Mucidula mucida]|nr:hypothetical protein CPB85DRAFT_376514 [Mucidula mucida]
MQVGGPGTLESRRERLDLGGRSTLIGVLASTANPLGNVKDIKFRASTLRGIYIGSVAQQAQVFPVCRESHDQGCRCYPPRATRGAFRTRELNKAATGGSAPGPT